MEKLQSLADKILAECDRHGNTLEQLEERVCQFESSCTTLSPEEAAQVVEELMKEIKVRKEEGGRERKEGGRKEEGGREGERERERRRMEGGREGGRERKREKEDGGMEEGREGEVERREGREGKCSEKNDHVIDPIQSLEAPVRDLTSGVKELRKGGYHDTETVQQW